jgi:hypothetical protein
MRWRYHLHGVLWVASKIDLLVGGEVDGLLAIDVDRCGQASWMEGVVPHHRVFAYAEGAQILRVVYHGGRVGSPPDVRLHRVGRIDWAKFRYGRIAQTEVECGGIDVARRCQGLVDDAVATGACGLVVVAYLYVLQTGVRIMCHVAALVREYPDYLGWTWHKRVGQACQLNAAIVWHACYLLRGARIGGILLREGHLLRAGTTRQTELHGVGRTVLGQHRVGIDVDFLLTFTRIGAVAVHKMPGDGRLAQREWRVGGVGGIAAMVESSVYVLVRAGVTRYRNGHAEGLVRTAAVGGVGQRWCLGGTVDGRFHLALHIDPLVAVGGFAVAGTVHEGPDDVQRVAGIQLGWQRGAVSQGERARYGPGIVTVVGRCHLLAGEEVAQRTLYDALVGFGHQCGVFQLGAVKYRRGVAYHDGLRADRRAAVQTVGVSPADGIVADGPVVCHGLV